MLPDTSKARIPSLLAGQDRTLCRPGQGDHEHREAGNEEQGRDPAQGGSPVRAPAAEVQAAARRGPPPSPPIQGAEQPGPGRIRARRTSAAGQVNVTV